MSQNAAVQKTSRTGLAIALGEARGAAFGLAAPASDALLLDVGALIAAGSRVPVSCSQQT